MRLGDVRRRAAAVFRELLQVSPPLGIGLVRAPRSAWAIHGRKRVQYNRRTRQRNSAHRRPRPLRAAVSIPLCIEIDAIDHRTRFPGQLKSLLHRNLSACRINAVREQHKCLSVFNRLEHLFQREPYSLIEDRTSPRPRLLYAPCVPVSVDAEVLVKTHIPSERKHCNGIVRMQEVHKADGFVLNLSKPLFRAPAGVQEKR